MRRRRGLARAAMAFALLVLAAGALTAAVRKVEPDPAAEFTARGRACMAARGYDARAIEFVWDLDGHVGYTSNASSDLRDLDAFVPRFDGTRGDSYSALTACIDELEATVAQTLPGEATVDDATETAIRECVASVPHSDALLGAVTIRAWDDGRLAIDYAYPDLPPDVRESLTAAIADCVPPANR